MTPEDRLVAFLSEDDAPRRPAVDALFVGGVMQRVARRELVIRLASSAATALAAGAVLWACAPVLDLAVHGLAPALAPTAGLLAFVLAATLLGGQILARR
ncbi:hypothetical protein PMI01_03953 [Caulobacter sp. AP07]|uniref:hypothetical protein n=1 Tax=Caulobacter sp. AP07 TaxID=1144304 RepID=UPI0002721B8C|nr:hypothetical protein [Caulobacter sp. AP07]EJL27181.1 hypothetical protein PMI01_03953 [Caulobacter sp. AP07]